MTDNIGKIEGIKVSSHSTDFDTSALIDIVLDFCDHGSKLFDDGARLVEIEVSPTDNKARFVLEYDFAAPASSN